MSQLTANFLETAVIERLPHIDQLAPDTAVIPEQRAVSENIPSPIGRFARKIVACTAGVSMIFGAYEASSTVTAAEAAVAAPAQGAEFLYTDINDSKTGNVDRCTINFGGYGGAQEYENLAGELAAALSDLQGRELPTAKASFKKILEASGRGFERESARCNHISVPGNNHPRAKEMARFTRRFGENVAATAQTVDEVTKPVTRPAIKAGGAAIDSLDCAGGWEQHDGCEPYTRPYMVQGHDKSTNRNYVCTVYTKGPERTDDYRKVAKAIATKHKEATDDYSNDLEDYVVSRLEANGGKYNPTTASCSTTQL